MSKIDDYKHKAEIARQLRGSVMSALGLHDDGTRNHDNDKYRMFLRAGSKTSESWAEKDLWLCAAYGFYGSSSGYSATSDSMRDYLVKAINEKMPTLAKRAVELCEADAEKARLAAAEEARAVLEAVHE